MNLTTSFHNLAKGNTITVYITMNKHKQGHYKRIQLSLQRRLLDLCIFALVGETNCIAQ